MSAEGFDDEANARLFSTLPALDGLRFESDGDGTVAFTLSIPDDAPGGPHYFIVARQAAGSWEPVGAFAVAVIAPGADERAFGDLVFEVLQAPVDAAD
ncbi:MAG: hypothetical protein GEU80_15770 [Dehalococcoidia bacterium]|nr:hypothetical protein [Dehalococcoidia bacterium]